MSNYTPSIGIECHVQLKTKTKLFNRQPNSSSAPNQSIGPLCLGLPGTLPVLNEEAVRLAIKAGLALNCQIASQTRFDRKHYFYPDLPLGYQISQHDQPIVGLGEITVPTEKGEFKVRLNRAHLEADAGKLTHPDGQDYSLVDLNRVGCPLLEIVSLPDIHSAQEAKRYAQELYLRMIYSEVCQGDLSAGHLRFDVNVSLSATQELGTRTEIKNLNSFRFIEQAVEFEIERQTQLLRSGQVVKQETRGWDENAKKTFSQRSKEEAQDYRYMPDPDIPPLIIKEDQVDQIRQSLGVSPHDVRQAMEELGFDFKQQEALLDQPMAGRLLVATKGPGQKILAKWLLGEILGLINSQKTDWDTVWAAQARLESLAALVAEQKVSNHLAKQNLANVIAGDDPANLKPATVDNQVLAKIIKQVCQDNPKAIKDAQNDPRAIGFFMGQVLRQAPKGTEPKLVRQLLNQYLADETSDH